MVNLSARLAPRNDQGPGPDSCPGLDLYRGPMTDAYPPFRLDQGGTDPGSVPASATLTAPLVPAG
jgi:hypothetical protein